jgi:hypothetical protein
MTILLIVYDWHGINPLFCVLSLNNYWLYQFDDLPVRKFRRAVSIPANIGWVSISDDLEAESIVHIILAATFSSILL